MKAKTLRLGLMLAVAAFWQISPLQAEELPDLSNESVSASYNEAEEENLDTPLGNVETVFEENPEGASEITRVGLFRSAFSAAGDMAGNCRDQYSCLRENCELPPPDISGCDSDCCSKFGVVEWFGSNAFKGISDGGAESNFGVVGGVNVGFVPERFSDRGIGFQVGGSYGVYDFQGRTSSVTENSSAQEQFFLTFGAFKRAQECQHFQGGIVYDVMANDNWGTFANEPLLTQWRVQGEYLLSDYNAVGVTIVRRDHGDDQLVGPAMPGAVANFRSVSQLNFFFHHRWDNGADSYMWLGFPEKQRPADGPGSLGQSIIGTAFQVPLTEAMGIYTTGTYMRPSAGPGPAGSAEETWNIGAGLTWFPGRNSGNPTVAGGCNMPYMPVANNGTFLVDRVITP